MSEDSDLSGLFGIRDVDTVRDKIKQAARETEILQDTLSTINVDVTDESFQLQELDPEIQQPDKQKINIQPNLIFPTVDTGVQQDSISTKFRQTTAIPDTKINVEPLTHHPLPDTSEKISPPEITRKEKDALMLLGMKMNTIKSLTPRIPEIFDIVPMTEETFDLVRREIHGPVAFIKPETFINLASTTILDEDKIEKLRAKIFDEKFDVDGVLPFFYVDEELNQIEGHEGRHRSAAVYLQQLKTGKDIKIPVSFSPRGKNFDEGTDLIELIDNIKPQKTTSEGAADLLEKEGQFRPKLLYGMSIGDFNILTKEFRQQFEQPAEERFGRLRVERLAQEKVYIDEKKEKFGDVIDKISDTAYDLDNELDIRDEIELSDMIFELGYVQDREGSVSDDEVTLNKYATIKDDVITFSKEIINTIGPELLKSIVDKTQLPSDIEFNYPEVEESDEEVSPDVLSTEEQQELVQQIVGYRGNISSEIKKTSMEDILDDIEDE